LSYLEDDLMYASNQCAIFSAFENNQYCNLWIRFYKLLWSSHYF